jgi:hypothetical protein
MVGGHTDRGRDKLSPTMGSRLPVSDHDLTSGNDLTSNGLSKFDFSAYPADALFHDRRIRVDRRKPADSEGVFTHLPWQDRRKTKERRKRVDPTTFDKQYTPDELEFMTAMQRFKDRSGKPFPSHRDVIRILISLGYLKEVACCCEC